MIPKELLKGSLQLLLLQLLRDEGRMYGYQITQRMREKSGDEIQLTEGGLYPALHKLEAQGLIEAEKEMLGKRVRKYYRLSDKGLKATQAKLEAFDHYIEVMSHMLQPTKDTK